MLCCALLRCAEECCAVLHDSRSVTLCVGYTAMLVRIPPFICVGHQWALGGEQGVRETRLKNYGPDAAQLYRVIASGRQGEVLTSVWGLGHKTLFSKFSTR